MGQIMSEKLLAWRLNGKMQPALLCSPGEEEALLKGHLLTGLFAENAEQIVSVAWDGNVWEVVTACTRVPGDLPERLMRLPQCTSPKTASLEELLRYSDELMQWDHTGGQHAVLLTDGEHKAFGCDIGRHNALDKAVGTAVGIGLRFDRTVMCTSGRISVEILAKAAAVGIPILCTRKQVGSLACLWAEKTGITIVQTGKDPAVYGACGRVE